MWYEILPSAGIIFAAMSVPHFAMYVINKLAIGNPYRRSMSTKEFRLQYLRDRRLTDGGSPYKVLGLDAIPDK